MVYDVTNKESFERIKMWNDEVQEHGQQPLQKILIGNKVDLDEQRISTTEDGQRLANELGMDQFMETSAKTVHHIDALFDQLAEQILNMVHRAERPWFG